MATQKSTQSTRKASVKQSAPFTMPSQAQVQMLFLDRAIYEVDYLIKVSGEDPEWSDKDIDVDNILELSMEKLMTIMVGEDSFVMNLYFVLSALRLAHKAFSRPDTFFFRWLTGTLQMIEVGCQMIDYAEKTPEVSNG